MSSEAAPLRAGNLGDLEVASAGVDIQKRYPLDQWALVVLAALQEDQAASEAVLEVASMEVEVEAASGEASKIAVAMEV